MKACDLNERGTFYASHELKKKLISKMKDGDTVVNFAYTDYGGEFLDKMYIEYISKKYPDKIISENTDWSGQNAFIWGKLADEFLEATDGYALGFDDAEAYHSMEQNRIEVETFTEFLRGLDREKFSVRRDGLDRLLEGRGGQFSLTTQGLDFCYSSLLDYCIRVGIISEKRIKQVK